MKQLLNLLFCLGLIVNTFAVNDISQVGLQNSNVAAGATINVQDYKYAYMQANPGWGTEFTNFKNSAYIELSFNQNDLQYFSNPYSSSVELEISSWDENGNALPVLNRTLTVEFDPDPAIVVKDISKFVLPTNAYSVSVSILNTTGNNNNLNLIVSIETERYYDFDPLTSVTGQNIVDETYYFSPVWNPVPTAEFYELEYTFVKDYNNSSFDYDFYRNATRIRITENFHRIPKVFSKGYFVYRVRPVGKAGVNFEYDHFGEWSLPESGDVNTIPATNKLYLNEHNNATSNWSSSSFFMQDGSRIDNVSYSDGLGRYRQGIVKDNENLQILVDNLYYDYSGRAVISHLPTPVTNDENIYYRSSFNKSADGLSPYGPQHYDLDGNGCAQTDLQPMYRGLNGGTGNYYSDQNPYKDGAQKLVPDGNGFPFARIQYSPDNSGRIVRSSGFGENHHLESGNITEVSYQTMTHSELSRLFGSDIGKKDKYMKMTTKDANGQKSCKIYNSNGQVVASYLMGSPGDGLDALPSNVGATNVEDILTQGYLFNTPGINSMSFTDVYEAEANGQVELYYFINPEEYNIADNSCIPAGICYDCVYDVEITVTIDKNCSNDFETITKTETINGLPIDFTCNGDDFEIDYPSFSFGVQEGETYVISKTVTISEQAIEDYTCHYINNLPANCGPDFNTIYTDIYNNTTIDNCAPTVTQNPGTPLTFCEKKEARMLKDMSPNGQYGLVYDTDPLGNTIFNPSAFPLSVFNTANSLPSGFQWNNPTIPYTDIHGNVLSQAFLSSITVEEFVTQYWKEEYAESLIEAHPEYCYLNYCNLNSASHAFDQLMMDTESFDDACALGLLDPVSTLLDRMSSGGGLITDPNGVAYNINILGMSSCADPGSTSTADQSLVNDPFFMIGAEGENVWSDFSSSGNGQNGNSIGRYLYYGADGRNGGEMSMWAISYMTVICPDIFLNPDGTPKDLSDLNSNDILNCIQREYPLTECEKNAIWRDFRNRYLTLKKKYYSELETSYTIENKCYNGCIGNNPFDQSINSFNCFPLAISPSCVTNSSNYDGYADGAQPCHSSTYAFYENKYSIFFQYDPAIFDQLSLNDINNEISVIQNEVLNDCGAGCQTMADEWMLKLSGCNIVSQTVHDAIKAELIELCSLGCDLDNLNGSSSLSSGSTLNGNTSFYEVLQYHLGTNFEDELCSDLLISDPRPHGQSYTIEEGTLDDCGCDKVLTTEYHLNNGNTQFIGTATNLEEAFEFLYGYQVTGNIVEYACVCNRAFAKGSALPYDPVTNNTWSATALQFLTDQALHVPNILTCGACTDCAAVQTAFNNFISRFSGINDFYNTPNYDELMESFMNNELNFHLTSADYEIFLANCNSTSTDPVCYPNSELTSLVPTWDLIAKLGLLETNAATPLNLNDYAPYNYSEFKSNQVAHNYWTTYNSSTQTLTMYYGESGSNCQISLTMPASSTITFDQIVGFSSLIPVTEDCGSNYDFEVTVWYYDCGSLVSSAITGISSCVPVTQCYCGSFAQTLCDQQTMSYGNNDCWQLPLSLVASSAMDVFEDEIESMKTQFQNSMMDKCKMAFNSESFKKKADVNRYHFTLMYYDRAGNLVQTVTPQGRDLNFTGIDPNDVGIPTTPEYSVPNHILKSNYRYNTFGQVTEAVSPDEGKSNFWYDRFGRLIASQNAKQENEDRYMFTLFDEEGRVSEFGQVKKVNGDLLTEVIAKGSQGEFEAWVDNANSTREEWNHIFYDSEMNAIIPTKFKTGSQENLRLRISSIAYYISSNPNDLNDYLFATHYSYDEHGNIIETVQDVALGIPEVQYVSTQYDFEKITGKIREIIYNEGAPDELVYTYEYDKNHRMQEVYSLSEGVFKNLEAKYQFYDHGPLAREELGALQIQGSDYSYTINGWLKGVNSNTLNTSRDPGSDNGLGYLTNNNAVHSNFSEDIYGFSLGYFQNDYTSIGATNFEADEIGSSFETGTNQLFNGAISHSVTAIDGLEILGYSYQYDQLYRLTEMDAYRGVDVNTNNWASGVLTTDYQTRYSYYADGDLESLKRNAFGAELDMDDFTYMYPNATLNHQLDYVQDAGTDYSGYQDIKQNQNPLNYQYDELGRIIRNNQEGYDVEWNSRNLISVINYDNGDKMEFWYNAQGARTIKIFTDYASGDVDFYYYGLDGSSSPITIYEIDVTNFDVKAKEQFLYGSGRVATWNRDLLVYNSSTGLQDYTPADGIYEFDRGERNFEMVNHLGNVLVVVNDKKEGLDENQDGQIDRFRANKTYYSDYYPFGMQMPGRTGGDQYRYAFNGMEQDPEFKGNGNSYTTPFRQYDPRLGRWMTPDPLASIQPWQSPYIGMDNNPISLTDRMGLKASGGDYCGSSCGFSIKIGFGAGASPLGALSSNLTVQNLTNGGAGGGPPNGWKKFVNAITGKGYINKAYKYAKKNGKDPSSVIIGDGYAIVDESEYYTSGKEIEIDGVTHYLTEIQEKYKYFYGNKAKRNNRLIGPNPFNSWRTTETANSIGDLVTFERYGLDEIQFGRLLMEKVAVDPEIRKWTNELIDEVLDMQKKNPDGKINHIRELPIRFGPEDKLEAAGDELTWAVRHVYVKASVVANDNIPGTIHIYFSFEDDLDLVPQDEMGSTYNAIVTVLGFIHHDLLGGTKAKTKANWIVEYSKLSGAIKILIEEK